jgi:hypothetical protein
LTLGQHQLDIYLKFIVWLNINKTIISRIKTLNYVLSPWFSSKVFFLFCLLLTADAGQAIDIAGAIESRPCEQQ